jgi:hypothetical protein
LSFPGADHIQTLADNCFQTACAYCLDLHPEDMPYISPKRYSQNQEQWWLDYNEALRTNLERELKFHPTDQHSIEFEGKLFKESYENLLNSDTLWIALVESLRYGTKTKHAIVMRGSKLEYDPAPLKWKRQIKPKKFIEAITLERVR